MAKYKVQGIGTFVTNLIKTTKLSNKEILAKVKEQFPEAQTSMSCVAWYQTDVRNKAKALEAKAPVVVVEESPLFGWFEPINTEVEVTE